MRRRTFITLLGGAAATLPLIARAQQGEQMRRIGIFTTLAADDPETKTRHAALIQSLRGLGWVEGRNLQVEYRFGVGNLERIRKFAAELVALAPEVIVATGSPTVNSLHAATRSIPVVFMSITDPVGSGLVESLGRPGGNLTGFTIFEYGIGGKWLQLIKEIAPRVSRAAVLRDQATAAGIGQLGALQSVAPSLAMDLVPIDVRDAAQIERGVGAFARQPNGSLIVTAGLSIIHRALIISLAARYRLPAIYTTRLFTAAGGLISYGPDRVDPYRRAAGYVDRILKGEKPADLPVQAPTRYELVINLKTAKTLGLTVPPSLLARADEVIE